MRGLVEELFRPAPPARPDGSLGAELELIPIRSSSHARVGMATTDSGPGTVELVRAVARVRSWIEETDSYGAPLWTTADGGKVLYEPGGQLEVSSPVFGSAAELESFLRDTVQVLRESAHDAGILLLTSGVDPYNSIEQVPQELHGSRYDAMTRYFDAIGPSGARMMRQTGAFQLSVELGPDVMQRWALLNALAPYLVAAFANSPSYAGSATGFASYRARLWQTLDSTRTGMPFDRADPVAAYTRFARSAGRILDDDAMHLTTLFPEIRPRGYFEIRSMDSMEPERA
ncbi:MAG TPA: glutamate-cysteine ligase family protein, partial [Gemmatimonadaceae bacterium]